MATGATLLLKQHPGGKPMANQERRASDVLQAHEPTCTDGIAQRIRDFWAACGQARSSPFVPMSGCHTQKLECICSQDQNLPTAIEVYCTTLPVFRLHFRLYVQGSLAAWTSHH